MQVLRGHKRFDGLMGDLCDGEACKSHPLFSTDSDALQILLYYDDIEVTNPLGSHTKIHKVGESDSYVCRFTCALQNQS